jgi:hypothetical protein
MASMSGLKNIGVHVVHVGGDGNARAVLREIEALLQKLVEQGEESSIDLSGLPLTPRCTAWGRAASMRPAFLACGG